MWEIWLQQTNKVRGNELAQLESDGQARLPTLRTPAACSFLVGASHQTCFGKTALTRLPTLHMCSALPSVLPAETDYSPPPRLCSPPRRHPPLAPLCLARHSPSLQDRCMPSCYLTLKSTLISQFLQLPPLMAGLYD